MKRVGGIYTTGVVLSRNGKFSCFVFVLFFGEFLGGICPAVATQFFFNENAVILDLKAR